MGRAEPLDLRRDAERPGRAPSRLRGPGGLYNMGNLLGLVAGLTFQFIGAETDGASPWLAVRTYLVGSPGATSLTVAMLFFFWSGACYHRADACRTGETLSHLRRADLLSGVAALFLSVALALFGDVWLALTSTIFLAGGKFGNAFSAAGMWPMRLEILGLDGTMRTLHLDLFRMSAVLSRVPALIATSGEILRLSTQPGENLAALSQSAVLMICFCLWVSADLMLFDFGRDRKTGRGSDPQELPRTRPSSTEAP